EAGRPVGRPMVEVHEHLPARADDVHPRLDLHVAAFAHPCPPSRCCARARLLVLLLVLLLAGLSSTSRSRSRCALTAPQFSCSPVPPSGKPSPVVDGAWGAR